MRFNELQNSELTEATKTVMSDYYDRFDLHEGAGLSRVKQHVEERAVAMLSAFRDEFSLDQNRKRNKSMEQAIRKAGYGFLRIDGGWVEEQEDGTKKKVKEESFFVIGPESNADEFKRFILNLGARFDQDAVLYVPAETDIAYGIDTGARGTKGKAEKIGKFSPKAAEDFWSNLRGHPFIFESYVDRVYQGSGVIHRMKQNSRQK